MQSQSISVDQHSLPQFSASASENEPGSIETDESVDDNADSNDEDSDSSSDEPPRLIFTDDDPDSGMDDSASPEINSGMDDSGSPETNALEEYWWDPRFDTLTRRHRRLRMARYNPVN